MFLNVTLQVGFRAFNITHEVTIEESTFVKVNIFDSFLFSLLAHFANKYVRNQKV